MHMSYIYVLIFLVSFKPFAAYSPQWCVIRWLDNFFCSYSTFYFLDIFSVLIQPFVMYLVQPTEITRLHDGEQIQINSNHVLLAENHVLTTITYYMHTFA